MTARTFSLTKESLRVKSYCDIKSNSFIGEFKDDLSQIIPQEPKVISKTAKMSSRSKNCETRFLFTKNFRLVATRGCSVELLIFIEPISTCI